LQPMIFLNPGFLYALIVLAIPIIIHLFNFRRTRKIYFSNTRFLRKVKEVSSAKRRLKHYLILASRLLFLFFLVIAFCQPFLPAEDNISSSGKNIIYVDNSLSMSNEVDRDLTGLDAARLYVQNLLELYPEATQYKLITNDYSTFSNSFKSKAEISDFLTEIDYSGSSRTAAEIKERIELESEDGTEDIFWISDFQKSILADEALVFDSAQHVNLIPLSFNSLENVSVDSVYLNTPILIGDTRPQITAVLSNSGLSEIRDLLVKVVLNEVEVATGTVSIQPGDKAELTFDLSLELEAVNKGRITLEEFPVTFDNDFYFTLGTSRKVNVLEIKGQPDITPVQMVFGNDNIFQFESFEADNLDYSLIQASDLIVIHGLSSIESSLVAVLNAYLDEGGSLLLIPAYRPNILSYKQLRGLNSLRLTDTSTLVALATPNFDNPFFDNVFEEKIPAMAMPKVTATLTWVRDRSAILQTQAGVPYLSELKSKGSAYVLAAPLLSAFGSFQDHALFVPVMYRLAIYGAKHESKLYEFIDSETIVYSTSLVQSDAIVKLKGQEEIIPSYRLTSSEFIMQLPKYLLNAGFYDLEIDNEVKDALAFNYAADESYLEQEADQLFDYFKGNIDLLNSGDVEKFRAAVENKYKGLALWKYAVCLALFFLFCEVLLIRFLT
ncbi:MAG: BatA domain-containing protein, partial [Bacteroidota bacterium]